MKLHKLLFASMAISLLAAGCNQEQTVVPSTHSKTAPQSCRTITATELKTALPYLQDSEPSQASEKSRYTQDLCFLAVDVFEDKTKEQSMLLVKTPWLWIVDTRTLKATKLVGRDIPPQLYFDNWTSNSEVVAWGKSEFEFFTLDVVHDTLVEKKQVKIDLAFPIDLKETTVTVSSTSLDQSVDCTGEKELDKNILTYPFVCFDLGDVTIKTKQKGKYVFKLKDKEDLEVNGKFVPIENDEGHLRMDL